jgi:hypothetical protein
LSTRALELDKKYARALYDRACYRYLQKRSKKEELDERSKKEVWEDLGKAFELNDKMRNMATQDPDFDGLEKDEDFLSL